MSLSIKSERLLEKLGVRRALERGESPARVGPIYEVRKHPGTFVQLAFWGKAAEPLFVGYMGTEGGTWTVVEGEPLTLRTLGYYQRRLKRIGDYVGKTLPTPGSTD